MQEAIAEIRQASKLQKLQLGLGGLWRGLIDIITPPLCLGCSAQVMEPASLCTTCWGTLRFLDHPVCDVMGTPFAYDQGEGILSAEALADPPGWDRARAAVLFDEHSKEIVHQLKYRDRAEAGIFMGPDDGPRWRWPVAGGRFHCAGAAPSLAALAAAL